MRRPGRRRGGAAGSRVIGGVDRQLRRRDNHGNAPCRRGASRCLLHFPAWTPTWRAWRSSRTSTAVLSPTSGRPSRRVCPLPTSRRSAAGSGSKFRGARSAPTWRCGAPPGRRPAGPSLPGQWPSHQPVGRPVVVKVAHDEFREPFVEIYARHDTGKRLVTSIEVLSLSNKTPGEHGRDLYLQSVFNRCYDAGPYLREIRYGEDAVIPSLSPTRPPGPRGSCKASRADRRLARLKRAVQGGFSLSHSPPRAALKVKGPSAVTTLLA